MKYEDVSTPEELLEFMDIVKYGFVTMDGLEAKSEEEFDENIFTKWRLSSPERLIDVGYGHCWDQVELERDWFSKHNYEFKTFYIWFELDYENPFSTHTYLVYKDKNKWKRFEHSDYADRGIHEFDTLEDAVENQKKRQIDYNMVNNPTEEELKCVKVYEYPQPKYNIDFDEFIDHVLSNGKVFK